MTSAVDHRLSVAFSEAFFCRSLLVCLEPSGDQPALSSNISALVLNVYRLPEILSNFLPFVKNGVSKTWSFDRIWLIRISAELETISS
jgi:hypothetical protein